MIARANELLGAPLEFEEREISVTGHLVSGQNTFIEDSENRSDSNRRIFLPHPQVKDLLMEEVPVLLGCQNLYDETCVVTGVLQRSGSAPSGYILVPSVIEISRGHDVHYRVAIVHHA